MMYPWAKEGLGFLRSIDVSVNKKEVQLSEGMILNEKDIAHTKRTDYESEGRAFESLRVRHFPPATEDSKNWFVPLIVICTSFFAKGGLFKRTRLPLMIVPIVLILALLFGCVRPDYGWMNYCSGHDCTWQGKQAEKEIWR